jgi:hypothetical protein
VKDCNGNYTDSRKNKIAFGLPGTADKPDIPINEILFNPKSGGLDFAELYNNTTLANIEIEKESGLSVMSNRKEITGLNYLLASEEFMAKRTNVTDIHHKYPQSFGNPMLEMKRFPSFPDEAGTVMVSNEKKQIN